MAISNITLYNMLIKYYLIKIVALILMNTFVLNIEIFIFNKYVFIENRAWIF